MKYTLTIEVACESKGPDFFDLLAEYEEPVFEFDRLDDLVAFLDRVATAANDDGVRDYAAQVKREGAATERVVRRWKNRKEVTLKSEVEKAVAAANASPQPAGK